MKTQRKQTNPSKTRNRRTKRAPAGVDEMVALGSEYLRSVTSGSRDDDDCSSADLRGFHFFGLN